MLEVDCATEMGLAPARPISRIRNASPAPRDSTSQALSVLVSSAVLYFRPPLFWLHHSHGYYLVVIRMPVQCQWVHLDQLFVQWNLFLHNELYRTLVHPMCPRICWRWMCWFVACYFFFSSSFLLLYFLPSSPPFLVPQLAPMEHTRISRGRIVASPVPSTRVPISLPHPAPVSMALFSRMNSASAPKMLAPPHQPPPPPQRPRRRPL